MTEQKQRMCDDVVTGCKLATVQVFKKKTEYDQSQPTINVLTWTASQFT